MSAHTPGPWSWWTSNSHKRLTAEGKRDGGVLHASGADWPTVVVSEADGCLIAAAPDMLAALKRCTAQLDMLTKPALKDCAALIAGRAAILKATGEAA